MRLVIDVPEGMREALIQGCFGARYSLYDLAGCVVNGTILPKGHGRLIDADSMKTMKNIQSANFNAVQLIRLWIDKQPTIIEADTTRDCKTCGHSNGGKCARTEECHDCMWESKYIEADKEEQG